MLKSGQVKRALFILAVFFALRAGEAAAEESPQEYARQSEIYYKKAEDSYKRLILAAKDPSRFYLGLGELYYSRGEYDLAIAALKKSSLVQAEKFLALSFYRLGNFTQAMEVFNRHAPVDEESYYYLGLTCQRLNLFDQALAAYGKIREKGFKPQALLRIEEIERKKSSLNIRQEDLKTAKIIAASPDSNAYPQAGALILLAKEAIEIKENNTLESDIHYLIKVLNERGKESFAESLIEYDSTFERVELEYARTIKPDGSVVYVGSRHIRDVSKYLNFPLYSNARVMIISFPEVAVGSVLEYKVRIKRSQLVNKKDFFLAYPVQSYEPVIFAEFRITAPKNKQLRSRLLNQEYNDFKADLTPVKEEKDGKVTYSWAFKNIPQIIAEPSMPPDAQINPTLLFSTFPSWKDVYEWWWAMAKEKIEPDTAIKRKVRALIKGKSSDLERARAIYNFCAKEIRYVAVEYGQAGYQPHSAFDIFTNKYGDCKDQAVLLVTMLTEAGFKAYPVLISTKSYYNMNEDFPSGIFNHCIAVLYLKDKKVFLDPTAQTCSFGDLPLADQGRRVLVFKEDGYAIEEIPLQDAGHNLVRQALKIRVNRDESIYAEKESFTLGAYNQSQRYWLLYTQPELVRDAIKMAINEISAVAILNKYSIDNLHDLNNPVSLRYDFRGSGYFTDAGPLRIMPQLSSIDNSIISKEARKYPIDLGLLDKRESYLEVALPEDFIVEYMPDNIKYDNRWFNFIQEYGYKNNKISVRQVNYAKKDRILQKEYPEFKDAMEKLAGSVKQRIVLKRAH